MLSNSVNHRVILLIIQLLVACGPRDESDVDAKDACEGKFGLDLNVCRNGFSSQTEFSAITQAMQSLRASANRDEVGRPHAIKYAGDYKDCRGTQTQGCGPDSVDRCLTLRGDRVIWEQCNPRDINQQFHFVDIYNVKYEVHKNIPHESAAFQISPRASAVKYQTPKAGQNPVSDLKCLIPLPTHVGVTACKNAPFFVTLMSRHDDDDDLGRLTGGKYVSLMALMKDTARINDTIKKKLVADTESQKQQENSWLDGALKESKSESKKDSQSGAKKDLKRALREKPTFLDLGSVANRGGCGNFRLITKDGQKAVGKCPSGDVREEQNRTVETRVFVTPCRGSNLDVPADCSGLSPIKNLYDHLESGKIGPVVKILTEGGERKKLSTGGWHLAQRHRHV